MFCRPSNYKTRMCMKWQQHSECLFGNKCNFAHGNDELRNGGATPSASSGGMVSHANPDGKEHHHHHQQMMMQQALHQQQMQNEQHQHQHQIHQQHRCTFSHILVLLLLIFIAVSVARADPVLPDCGAGGEVQAKTGCRARPGIARRGYVPNGATPVSAHMATAATSPTGITNSRPSI